MLLLFGANKSTDARAAAAAIPLRLLLDCTCARTVVLLALALGGCGSRVETFVDMHELAVVSHHVAATPRTGAMLHGHRLQF